MKYEISVRQEKKVIKKQTNNYMEAWEIYFHFVKKYPKNSLVEILDMESCEIFQSNDPDF